MKLLCQPISSSDQIPDRFSVISIEFLSLSRRRSSSRNVPQWRWARRNFCHSQARIFLETYWNLTKLTWSLRSWAVLDTILKYGSAICCCILNSTRIKMHVGNHKKCIIIWLYHTQTINNNVIQQNHVMLHQIIMFHYFIAAFVASMYEPGKKNNEQDWLQVVCNLKFRKTSLACRAS